MGTCFWRVPGWNLQRKMGECGMGVVSSAGCGGLFSLVDDDDVSVLSSFFWFRSLCLCNCDIAGLFSNLARFYHFMLLAHNSLFPHP